MLSFRSFLCVVALVCGVYFGSTTKEGKAIVRGAAAQYAQLLNSVGSN